MAKTTDQRAAEIEAYFERATTATARGWKPEPGTTLKGEVVSLRMAESDYRSADRPDGRYPVVTYRVLDMFRQDGTKVESAAGTIALHVFHKVLSERLQELGTDIGSVQYVTYIGPVDHNTEKNPDGTPKQYHMYYAENEGTTTAGGREEGFTFG